MSWHCVEWWRNIPLDVPLPDHGQSIEALHHRWGCRIFRATLRTTVDSNESIITVGDTADDVRCEMHDPNDNSDWHYPNWDDENLADELDRHTTIYVCHACELAFQGETPYERHRRNEHNEYDALDELIDEIDHPTLHGDWA